MTKILPSNNASSQTVGSDDPAYADVIIPLAVKDTYSYIIPTHLKAQVVIGKRVEVPFGKKKLYAGLVLEVHHNTPQYSVKEIRAVLDDAPIVVETQLKLWQWMAKYYICGIGEVMHAALPSQLRLSSETTVVAGNDIDEKIFDLDKHHRAIAEAVSIQRELSIDRIRDILGIKTVYPVIKYLLENDIIFIKEELKPKYKPREVTAVRLGPAYLQATDKQTVFNLIKRSDKQTTALLALIHLSRNNEHVLQEEIMSSAQVNHAVLKALEKKDIIVRYTHVISRIDAYAGDLIDTTELAPDQSISLADIQSVADKPVLLMGVTGSGKTHIYIELIRNVLEEGKQALYLLPEIALTTQVVGRLQRIFGDDLLVYHSRLNEHERVEVWQKTLTESKVILGARSALFLPFPNLGLIVVDEEHDPSYKQDDPNPRYQARDTSIVLAKLVDCRIILGSATPSLESFFNVTRQKYHLVSLSTRFGNMEMPEITLVDLKKGPKSGYFSHALLDQIDQTKKDGYQTILFQNRRGFAPLLLCTNCGWSSMCRNCDTSLTYHKYFKEMQCHLCGYRERPALVCPACGNHELTLKGFGTELLEDELKIRLPDLQISRLDLDTARGKKRLAKIIGAFEDKEIDVLIGTQMVTKGLDFESVGLVGIVSADHLLYYPDFRATERAFQLMTQVSGRSGRKGRRGRVMIQAYNTGHPVIQEVIDHNYEGFYNREIQERKEFAFPPFVRIIRITCRHRVKRNSERAASLVAASLQRSLGNRVSGPFKPGISRVRNLYLNEITIKLEKDAQLIARTKVLLEDVSVRVRKQPKMSTLRITINVDP